MAGNSHNVGRFTLAANELATLLAQKYNGKSCDLGKDANHPTLTIDYSGITGRGQAQVKLNGHFLGNLDRQDTETEFNIPLAFLCDGENLLDIFNTSNAAFFLAGESFYSGSLGTAVSAVPLPASLLLFVTGLLPLWLCGPRKFCRRR